MTLRVLTSFSPNPERAARQMECVLTWLELGAEVYALQGAREQLPGFDQFPIHWRSSKLRGPVFLDEMWQWGRDLGGPVLLLNSDIELTTRAVGFELFERSIGGDLICIRRTDYALGCRGSGTPLTTGIDGFFCRMDELQPFVGTRFAIGRPVWDYWLPLFYLDRGRRIFLAPDIAYHEIHPQHWSGGSWQDLMRHALDTSDKVLRPKRFLMQDAREMTARINDALTPLELSQ